MTLFRNGDASQPWLETEFVHGRPHGRFHTWNVNGAYNTVGHFRDGAPSGTWHTFLQQSLMLRREFEAGHVKGFAFATLTHQRTTPPLSVEVDGTPVADLDEAIAGGDAVTSLTITGWPDGRLPEAIWGLTGLRVLRIRRSMLEELPAALGDLQNLETLEISNTLLKNLPAEVARLRRLVELDLQTNNLSQLPVLENPELRVLMLSANPLGVLTSHLEGCPRLEKLWMTNTLVAALEERVFASPVLRDVNLCAGSLAWMPSLGEATALETLRLEGNALLEAPAGLGSLARIETLWMNRNALAEAPRDVLSIGRIKSFSVSDNPFLLTGGGAGFPEELEAAWDAQRSPEEMAKRRIIKENLRRQALGLAQRASYEAHELGEDLDVSTGLSARDAIAPITVASTSVAGAWKDRMPGDGADGPWSLADGATLAGSADGLTSDDFGCEHGDYPVEVFAGPGRAVECPLTELLMFGSVLRAVPLVEAATLCADDAHAPDAERAREAGRRLAEQVGGFAPAEGWVFEPVRGQPDFRMGLLVLQLADGVWVVIGPKPDHERSFRVSAAYPSWSPDDGKAAAAITALLNRSSARALTYELRGRVRYGDTQVSFGRTRHRALTRFLTAAGVATCDPIGDALDRETLRPLADQMARLRDGRAIVAGANSLYHRYFVGRGDDGVVGVRTQTVWS